jgi:hypothetical protein
MRANKLLLSVFGREKGGLKLLSEEPHTQVAMIRIEVFVTTATYYLTRVAGTRIENTYAF